MSTRSVTGQAGHAVMNKPEHAFIVGLLHEVRRALAGQRGAWARIPSLQLSLSPAAYASYRALCEDLTTLPDITPLDPDVEPRYIGVPVRCKDGLPGGWLVEKPEPYPVAS